MSYVDGPGASLRTTEMSRFSTILNGRYDGASDGSRPALLRDPEPATGRWRRFVQLLNLRGETMGDE